MPFPARELTTSNKVDALAEQLERIARERGPDRQMPTAREIREALGVGMSTVNDALSSLEAKNVIYRKHGVGIFVSPRLHRREIAVLMDDRFFLSPGTSPFWSILWGMLIRAAERRAEPRNEAYHFNVVTLFAEEGDALPQMVKRSVEAGRIHAVLGVGLEERAIGYLRERKIPTVNFAGPGRHRVDLDATHTIDAGVRALAGQGCKTIALWRPVTAFRPVSLEYIVHPEEIGAFTGALKECGLPLLHDQVRQALHLLRGDLPYSGGRDPMTRTTLTHQEQGFLLATDVFGDADPDKIRPDGIVLTDDMMTWGVLTALSRLGIRVGSDIRIATHANAGSNVLFGYEKDVTIIEVRPEEIVEAMYSLLDRLSAGESETEEVITVRAKSP